MREDELNPRLLEDEDGVLPHLYQPPEPRYRVCQGLKYVREVLRANKNKRMEDRSALVLAEQILAEEVGDE